MREALSAATQESLCPIAIRMTSSKPIRVLFISHSGGMVGGGERSLLTILTCLDKTRFLPLVVFPEEGELLQSVKERGIECEVQPLTWWLGVGERLRASDIWPQSLDEASRLLPLVQAWQPDIIYTNTVAVPQGAIVANMAARPHIWHSRETLTGSLMLPLPRELFFSLVAFMSARVIAVSPAMRSQFPELVRQKVTTIYNGIDASERWHAFPDPLPETGPMLVQVGTVVETKGQLQSVMALRRLLDFLPTARLTLMGAVADPAYAQQIDQYISEQGIGDRVTVAGYVSNARDLLADFDLALMPSTSEAFGRVVVEAMSAGVPVVASCVEGLADIVARGGGVLVPPNDPEAMAMVIWSLWRNREALTALAGEARQTAAFFSVERMMARIESTIQEVASRP
jgi:glycosyltransferase involved in cell wall biosynthesis